MGRWVAKKKTWLYDRGKKLKPPILESKAMSTSVLYHTFGVSGVQHRKTDFLMVKPFSTALFIPAT
jgi:hypothetical protein